jgi:hypothetical protein
MEEVVALHARQPLLNLIEAIDLSGATAALVGLESGLAPGRFVITY